MRNNAKESLVRTSVAVRCSVVVVAAAGPGAFAHSQHTHTRRPIDILGTEERWVHNNDDN